MSDKVYKYAIMMDGFGKKYDWCTNRTVAEIEDWVSHVISAEKWRETPVHAVWIVADGTKFKLEEKRTFRLLPG
jgi:hypothetical protein